MGLIMHEDEAYPEGDGSGGITDIDEATPSFEEAQTRTNIASGDTLSVIFGKIKKFFTDLATVAFSGSYNDLDDKPTLFSGNYNDLSNKPTIPTQTSQLTNNSGFKTSANTFNVTRGASVSAITNGFWAAMCHSTQTANTALPRAGEWWHVISMDWSNDANNWVSQLAVATQQNNGVWWRRNNAGGTSINSSTWHRLAEGEADGMATKAVNANYATNAGYASSAGSAGSASYSSYVYANSRTTHSSDVNNSFMIANGGHRVTIQQDCNLVVYRNNGSAAWSAGSSSKRFKHNIQSMTRERALKILKIRAVTFDWNDDQVITTQKCDNAGVIAEEVSRVLPDLVVYEAPKGDEERRERRVEYERFAPYLIKMVQIQQEEIDTLKKRIDILEKLVLSKGE